MCARLFESTYSWNLPPVHNKLKPKIGELPADLPYFSGDDVPDLWCTSHPHPTTRGRVTHRDSDILQSNTPGNRRTPKLLFVSLQQLLTSHPLNDRNIQEHDRLAALAHALKAKTKASA